MGKWYEVMYKPYHWENVAFIYTDFTEEYEVNEIGTEVSVIGHGRFVNLCKYTFVTELRVKSKLIIQNIYNDP